MPDTGGITQAIYTNTVHQYGDLISQRRAGTSSFYLFDALGSTDRLTDAGQAITDSYILDAWGNPVSSTGSTLNPFRFVGRLGYFNDVPVGRFYIRDRWYAASQGAWLSAYRIAADINLYRYSRNNPLLRTDPSGLAGDDIKYIDYLVNKYGLSAEGRAALHQALQEVKGVGGLAPKAVAEAEAQEIAALGGKYLKAGGIVLGVAAAWLSLENTAQAAELPTDWRQGAAGWDQRCSCECARFQVPLIVPSWWAAFNKVEWGPESRVTQWVRIGRLNAQECRALEDLTRIVSEESVVGFTIYNTSRVRCRFGGATYGIPKKCCE